MRDVAVVYSGDIRDNGSTFYTRMALVQIKGADVDWYTEDPSSPNPIAPGHEFYIHPDDGRDDLSVDKIPHPWGYWVVDSHLGPDVRIAKAKQADLVWCAQKPFVETLRAQGIKAKWLPLACEPEVHCTAAELAAREGREVAAPEFDLAFVGHIQNPDTIHAPANRLVFLDRLFKAFPNSWYAYGCFHEEMSRVYHRARLGVNHAVRDDLNMRFFELASMGIPQLADKRMVGLTDLGFKEWVHYIPYDSIESAIWGARAHLGGYLDGTRGFPAEAAKSLVRESHTYRHRLCTILEDIEQYLSSRGEACGPTSSGGSQP